MKRAVTVLTFILASCIDVDMRTTVDSVNVQVGPQSCDFIKEFATPHDPDYSPSMANGCEGYGQYWQTDVCLLECEDDAWCDSEHYCHVETATCLQRKTGGACTRNEECLTAFCGCGLCVDLQAMMSAGIEAFN